MKKLVSLLLVVVFVLAFSSVAFAGGPGNSFNAKVESDAWAGPVPIAGGEAILIHQESWKLVFFTTGEILNLNSERLISPCGLMKQWE